MRRLIALYAALPDEAVSKRESPDEAHWGTTEELLAQMVEEVSVLVAEKRRKEPRAIPRPWEERLKLRKRAKPGVTENEDGSMSAVGLAGALAFSQQRGAVKLG